jgi:hypothetical protein
MADLENQQDHQFPELCLGELRRTCGNQLAACFHSFKLMKKISLQVK